MKPYSEACEQNRQFILPIIRQTFTGRQRILEIGSGTGQHAVFFGAECPNLRWQTSDVILNHPGIEAWLAEAGLGNVLPPLALDVSEDTWPDEAFDGVFSANTAHIMHWSDVENLFAGIGKLLEPGGCFCLYGPFNINGQYTAASNARFDVWLKQRDPEMGVRDMADLDRLANTANLTRIGEHPMPADNYTLVWKKAEPNLG